MYPSLEEDFVADLLCFDQSNGEELDYTQYGVDLQHDQEDTFPDFGSYGVNLEPESEEIFSIGAQLKLVSYSEALPQEQVCIVAGKNNPLLYNCGIDQQEEEINSASSGEGAVKQEQEHIEDECSRKRGRTGSCSRPGTKACRERLRREKLNDRFMDLSAVLEPGRTPKTDKPAILDDAIRVLNQLRDEAQELEETNQKLLEEIKSLKAEKHELREEKLALKADKEKTELKLKSMAVQPAGFMPQHPAAAAAAAAFHASKMAMYPSYGYMPMWHYLPPAVRDTSRDQELRPPAA